MYIKSKVLITTLLLVLFSTIVFAQLSPYQGIINPYERYGGLGGSFGGVIIAEPDAVPSPLDNPAGIVFQRAPQVFVGMNWQASKYEHDYFKLKSSETGVEETEINPRVVAASYPLILLHREAALAFSLAKIPAPEFEGGYVTKIDTFPDMTHDRSGNVGTATIGVSIKVTPTFSVGLSYTRWLGSWKWNDNEILTTTHQIANKYGNGEFQYDGNCFNLGMIKQMNRFSIGLLLQSPFTLMHADNVRLWNWLYEENYKIEQQFKGAASLGISYRLFSGAKLGIGYRYQNELKYSFNDNPLVWKKNLDFHKLTVAGEYALRYCCVQIPIYLAWQRFWQEDCLNGYPGYITVYLNHEQRIRDSIQMGVNCYFGSYALHLGAQWQDYSIQLYNEQFRPPSSLISSTSWFDVKKTDTIINIGLSYFIK